MVLRDLISYAKTFDECYPVLFREAWMNNVCMDMESATFIPGDLSTVYNGDIRFDCLFIMHASLLDLNIELNNRDPVLPRNGYTKIILRVLTDLQIDRPKDHELLLFVVVFGYSLNTQFPKAPARRLQFVLTPSYEYEIDSFDLLLGYLATVSNRCPNQIHFSMCWSEQLWAVNTVWSMLMSQRRVFMDRNMTFDVEMGC